MQGSRSPRLESTTVHHLVANLLLLAVVFFFGDRYWMLICLVSSVFQFLTEPKSAKVVARLTPCLAWLVLYRITGNRSIFFPFCMYLASYATLLLASRFLLLGLLSGSVVAGAFAGVRIMQSAAKNVLGVELCVAGAILVLALAAYNTSPRNAASRIVISLLASLLAFASLRI